jgi:TrwC relaxase
MSLHKLTAGSGYDYLTRQVAALDATDKGRVGLADYYSAKGESPGRWVGAGMDGIDGLAGGDAVTAEQTYALFGAGMHPLAAEREAAIPDAEFSVEAAEVARRLGAPFKVYDNDVSPFRVAVAQRMDAMNRADGLPADWPVPASARARIRTEAATEFFRAEHGRDPMDAQGAGRGHCQTVAA